MIKSKLLIEKRLLYFNKELLHFISNGFPWLVHDPHTSVPPDSSVLSLLHVRGSNFQPDWSTLQLPILKLLLRSQVFSVVPLLE